MYFWRFTAAALGVLMAASSAAAQTQSPSPAASSVQSPAPAASASPTPAVSSPTVAQPSPSATPAASKGGFVVLIADKADKPKRTGSGVIISAANQILASADTIDGKKEVFVRFQGDDKFYPAKVDAADNDLGVALLHVESGPKAPAAQFAAAEIEAAARIHSLYIVGGGSLATVDGAIGNAAQVKAGRFWRHNAMIPADGFGGAVVNECHQLVGLNVVSPILSQSQARKLEAPQEAVYEAGREALMGFLSKQKVTPAVASAACQSATEAAKKEVTQAKIEATDAQKQKEEAEAKAKTAQKAADEAKAEAAKRKQEAERIRASATATEKEKQEADAAAKEAEKIAEQAAQEAAASTDALNALQKKLDAANAEVKDTQQNRLYWIVGGGAGIALVVILAAIMLGRRGKALKETRDNLAGAQADLARTFPDIECRGKDAAGNPHAFKITGASLLKASNGLVIGRQPQSANVVLNHPQISRAHVRISLRGQEVLVEDLDSTNGTSVNGVRLSSGEASPIRTGDDLSLGTITFKVRFLNA